MGELFLNKIAGAVLATLLLVFGLSELAHYLYHPHELEEPAYVIEVAETTTTDAPVDSGPPDYGVLLAEASVSVGERVAAKCVSCHTFDQGGANTTGPNLWNIVDRQSATVDGFSYSAAMREFGEAWTYENLDVYLTRPRGLIDGTAMSFAGLRKEDERMAIIAYLRSLSDNPAPLPAPLGEGGDAEPASEVVEVLEGAAEDAVEGEEGGEPDGE